MAPRRASAADRGTQQGETQRPAPLPARLLRPFGRQSFPRGVQARPRRRLLRRGYVPGRWRNRIGYASGHDRGIRGGASTPEPGPLKASASRLQVLFRRRGSLHTAHLQAALNERGYADPERVILRNSRFEDEADAIITAIQSRQPRAGRAIFLLDQTGFARVELGLVARILRELRAAEVILTFAADALVNHLSTAPANVKAVSPLQLTRPRIQDLIRLKDGAGGRALVQRTLRDHIRNTTGATYDTPFFIRPRQSRRALWFLHLSRHPTARDVMIQRHWDISGTFEHYGSGGFDMLGWDALRSTDTLRLFRFEELEAEEMRVQLLDSLPRELHALVVEEPVTVQTVRHVLANRTAARFSDLDDTVIELARAKEIDILNADGKPRSRSLAETPAR
ncbi:MAG: three-Cys-motif partner protein TcmP [Acidobacteria bacterium]|nr:three-Cys-motif partner protein TcmP [Acidobacteriota bacterium]